MISETESKGKVFEKDFADQQEAFHMQPSPCGKTLLFVSWQAVSLHPFDEHPKCSRKLDNCWDETLYYKYIVFAIHSEVQWCHGTVKDLRTLCKDQDAEGCTL